MPTLRSMAAAAFVAAVAFLAAVAIPCDANPIFASSDFTPASLTFDQLSSASLFTDSDSPVRKAFSEALTENGIVAITGIPGFKELRRAVFAGAHTCSKYASKAMIVELDDHTVRTTLAGVADGLRSHPELELGQVLDHDKCSEAFLGDVSSFRDIIGEVASAFVARMGDVFPNTNGPLLRAVDGTKSFNSLADIADASQHLEHFHSYSKKMEGDNNFDIADDQLSIDMHADQGLFIAFVPALLIEDDDVNGLAHVVEGAGVGEFYLQHRDGSISKVDFADGDELVFMLGDGIEECFNAKYAGPGLRAAPHAMTMPKHEPGQARAWYGRMFLPPDDALNERHGMSYKSVRQTMIEQMSANAGVGTGIGCSRKLLESDQPGCAENQIYCWMRCMNFTDDVNPQTCQEKGLGLKCMSQQLKIWRPQDAHGDYNPACTNKTDDWITPLPQIPDRPSSCGSDFQKFLGADEYDNSIELVPGTYWFLWKVADGALHAKLAYNDTVGYLAIGLPNPDDKGLNGMLGARIVMGIVDTPSKDDPAVFGAVWVGTGVREYIINNTLTAFRHWSTPVTPSNLKDAKIETTSCYTSMVFTTKNIAGWDLNLTKGFNSSLIWAAHADTYTKGYHNVRGHKGVVLNSAATATKPAVAVLCLSLLMLLQSVFVA